MMLFPLSKLKLYFNLNSSLVLSAGISTLTSILVSSLVLDLLNDDEIKSPKFMFFNTKNTTKTIVILSKYFFNLLELFGLLWI